MNKIIVFLILLLIISCSSEKKLRKKPTKKLERKSVLYYLPEFSSLIIKNNKLNKKIFKRDYSPSVLYEFNLNNSKHFLSSNKIEDDSLKLNYYYLSPVIYYDLGYFRYNLSEFDFYFNRNLFRIISLKDDEITLFSTGDDVFKGEISKEIKIFNTKEIDVLVHEENPLFYSNFVDFIDFKYKFKTLKSYTLVKYSQKIAKKEFYKDVFEESYILVVTLRDFEEITFFKKFISKKYIHHIIDLKDAYSTRDKKIFIFFNGDKIIFSKNINSLELLNKVNKIPLTKINKVNKNNGYVIVKNKKYLESAFNIFKMINFDGKVVYYFFDYKN